MTKDEALKMAIEKLWACSMLMNLDHSDYLYEDVIQALDACKEALEQPAQEPIKCDGKFPENFDASLGIPAQYLRLANGIMMDYMGNRSWDVPMCATAIMEYTNTHPHQWQGLSNDMVRAIGEKCQEKNRGILNWIDFYNTINEMLKEKNHG